jgi:hypothetical protein
MSVVIGLTILMIAIVSVTELAVWILRAIHARHLRH